MAIPGSANLLLAGSAQAYQIEQSLRFDDGSSSTLTRTPSSNGGSVHTTSAWIKASDPTLMANIFAAYPSESAYGTSVTYDILGWYSEGPYSYVGNGPGNESSLYLGAIDYSYKFRDTSAWYHVIWVSTSTQFQIYINGVLVASKSRTQNNSYYNQNKPHRISAYRSPGGVIAGYINCYMAEVHFIDGQALDHEDFGEFDDNGVWRPIEYAGTYGTNGYYLKFDPSATNGIGHDHSGNGNNWTASNFTTSGTGTDVMSDTPTNNFCTWNPIAKGGSSTNAPTTLSEGNLKHRFYRTGVGDYFGTANFAMPESGNYYWEVKVTNASSYFCLIGICEQDWIWNTSPTVRYVSSDGRISNHVSNPQGSYSYTGATYGNGDVIGCAWNGTNKTIQFYKNGSAQGSPLSPTVTTRKTFVPCWHAADDNWEVTINCGQRAFEYTPPSGYDRLCTADLPAPDIANGSANFRTVLYSGNGSSQSVTGVGFQPDFVWTKDRDNNNNYGLYDSVRGASKRLPSNNNNQEANDSALLNSFDSDGFTLGSDTEVNASGRPYVAWNWLAGGSSSSNTAGTITSTVSANPSAGFSVATYTGNGSTASFGHGLGVAPNIVIIRKRSGGTMGGGYSDWLVYSQAAVDAGEGSDAFVYLNSTGATSNSSSVFSSAPSSTVVNIGNNQIINNSGSLFVAYSFAQVEGFSKLDIFRGNGNALGPFIFCGFKPAWVMIKSVDNLGKWIINDATRSAYNVTNHALYADDYRAEESNGYASIDILSNGFKIRSNWSDFNTNGNKFIYMAFAQQPFGGDGISPATAR